MSETPNIYTTAILGSSVSHLGEGWRCIRCLPPLGEFRAAPPDPTSETINACSRCPRPAPQHAFIVFAARSGSLRVS
jgi:hypothetical protein